MKILLILFWGFVIFTNIYADYVYYQPDIIYQPDGTKINVFLTGDEYYNGAPPKTYEIAR